MQKLMNEEGNSWREIYMIGFIILFLVSLIPLLYIARYAVPLSDDFVYSKETQSIWLETHSVYSVIDEAVNTSIRFWQEWQGLYASAFIQALQPAIFGEKYYRITTYIMLFSLSAGMIVLLGVILTKFLHARVIESVFIGCMMSYLMIQTMPDIDEGLFWWNGAINYGLFWSIECMMIACVLSGYTSKNRGLYYLISCVIGVILEGGNHVTAFSGQMFFALLTIYSCYMKRKKDTLMSSIVFMCMMIAFFFNVTSPGTRIRQEYFHDRNHKNPIWAIVASVCHGVWRIMEWSDLKVLCVL